MTAAIEDLYALAERTVRDTHPDRVTTISIGVSLAELPGVILADVCELGARLDRIGVRLCVPGYTLLLECPPPRGDPWPAPAAERN